MKKFLLKFFTKLVAGIAKIVAGAGLERLAQAGEPSTANFHQKIMSCLSKPVPRKIFAKVLVSLLIFILIFSPLLNVRSANAAINKQINYQGKLTTSAGVAVTNGTYNMEFKLYTVASAGTAIWTETRIGADKVQVTSGLFSVMLGEVTALTGVDFNQTLYLGVNIGGTGSPSWDGEMTPRKKLGAVPAAVEAEHALTVTTNANLTGPITSVGNATSIAAQTGTGSIFVMQASPTFTGTVTIPTPFTLGATSVTTTGTQLNYLNAATGTTGTTSTNLVFSTSPTLVTPVLGAATYTTLSGGNITDSALTSGRVTFAGAAGLLVDDADLTFATDTLTAAKISVSASTASSSTTTGSLINSGGFGNAGNIYLGGELHFGNNAYLTYSGSSVQFLTNASAAQLVKVGGLVVSSSYSDTAPTNGVAIYGTTAATSAATGSLVNSGGFGNAGAGYFGGELFAVSGGGGIKLSASSTTGVIVALQGGGLSFRDDGNNALLTLADATGDAGLSGDLTVSGGNVGVGTAPLSDRIIYAGGTALTTGTAQYGIVSTATFGTGATTAGSAIYASLATAASAFTMGNGYAIQVGTPILGATSAVTTNTGISIANQGASGITNAYGIDIAAQSGAATTNVGLRNAGTTLLTNATASTSTSTGALVVSGGVGVAGKIYSGSDIIATSALKVIGSAEYYAAIASGTALYYGYDNVTTIIRAGGFDQITTNATSTTISNTTASTSTASGSLINAGGFGNAGNIYAGGQIIATNTAAHRLGRISFRDDSLEEHVTDSDTAAIAVNYSGYASGYTRFRDFVVYDGKGAQSLKLTGSTKSLDVVGTISVGSGYNLANSDKFYRSTGDYNVLYTNTNGLNINNQADDTGLITISNTGVTSLLNSTASSSTTTGSLVNAGGFGNAGNIYAGGNIVTAGSINITSNNTLFITRDGEYLRAIQNSAGDDQFQTWYTAGSAARRGYFGYGSANDNILTLENETNGNIVLNGSSSGNVGIRDTSPDYTLDVAGALGVDSDITTTGNVNINTSGTSLVMSPQGNSYAAMRFNKQPSIGGAAGFLGVDYGQTITSTSSNGDMVLRGDSNNIIFSNTLTEAMRISSAGLVGIGTTGPGSPLEVSQTAASAANSLIGITVTRAGGAAAGSDQRGVGIVFKDSDNPTLTAGISGIRTNAGGNYNGELAFFTNNGGVNATSFAGMNERMRIDTNGNIGVGIGGILNPAGFTRLLQISSTGSSVASFHTTANTDQQWDLGVTDPAGSGGNDFGLYDATAGSWRMVVQDVTGNVGIGITTPENKLHVYGGTLSVNGPLASYPTNGAINLSYSSGVGYISVGQDNSGTNADIAFSVGNNAEKMRILANGNVGIGTTAPGKLLEVNKNIATNTIGSGEVLRLIGDDGNNLGRVTELGFGVGPTGATYAPAIIGAVVTSATGFNKKDIYFATRNATSDTAPSEVMRITSAGNVGIGTASVPYKLVVNTGTDQNFHVRTGAYGDGTGILLQAANDANSTGVPLEFGASKFSFNVGNVGIGTTNPGNALEVLKATSSNWVSHIQSTTSGGGQVYFAHDGGYGAYIDAGTNASSSTYALNVNKNNTPYLYVKGDGNVGIGTASPAYTLDVTGGARVTGSITAGSISAPVVWAADGSQWDFLSNSSIYPALYNKDLIQDNFLFFPPYLAEKKVSGVWSSVGVNNDLFMGINGVATTITNGDEGYRMTWNNFTYKFFENFFVSGSTQGNNYVVTLETSPNGSSWTTVFTTNSHSDWPGYMSYQKFFTTASDPYVRVTFTPTWNNGNPITLNQIRYFGAYPTDGAAKLFTWDNTRNISFNGSLRTPDGTVGAPAFSFYNDTNLGIYRGGTDILRFATAGADRMTLDASGDVGIGTASPDASTKLHVSGVGGITVSGDFAGVPAVAGLALDYHSSDNAARISVADGSGGWTKNLALQPYGGNVGIGVTNPQALLQVAGTTFINTAAQISGVSSAKLTVVQTAGTTDWAAAIKGGTTTGGSYGLRIDGGTNSSDYALYVNNSSASNLFNVRGDGNVGIGRTDPDQKLVVNGGIGFGAAYTSDKKLYSPADGDLEWMTNNSAGAHGFAISHQGTKAVYLNTSGNSYLNGGNVGIGVTAPAQKLDITGAASTSAFMRVAGGSGATKGGVYLGNTTFNYGELSFDNSNNNLYLQQQYTSGNLMLGTNSSVDLTIDTSGNVGIGTTSPSYKLSVVDSGTGNGDAGIYLSKTGATSGNSFGMFSTLTGAATTNIAGYFTATNATNNYAIIVPPGGGNVGIGTSAPGSLLTVRSSGVDGTYSDILTGLYANDIEKNSIQTSVSTIPYNSGFRFMVSNGAGSAGQTLGYQMNRDSHHFYVSGSEKLTIDSSGNLGIGTTSPLGKLDVNGGNGTNRIFKEIATGQPDYTYYYLKLFKKPSGAGGNATTFNGDVCAIRSNDLTVSQCATIHASRSYDSYVYFSETVNAAGGSYARPFELVTYNDGTYDWVALMFNNVEGPGITSWTVDGTMYNANGDVIGLTQANSLTPVHSALTYTAKNNYIPYGNVGIGMYPAEKLSVNGDVTGGIQISAQAPTLYMTDQNGGQQSGFVRYDNGLFDFQTSSSRMTVGTDVYMAGNVGIGTAPSYKLHTVTASNGIISSFQSTGSGDVHGLYISINKDGLGNALDNYVTFHSSGTNSGGFTFAAGNTEVVRISDSGNVGIGTTNPYNKLEVAGRAQIGTGTLVNSTSASLLVSGPNNYGDGDTSGSIVLQRYWNGSDSDTRSVSIFHGVNNGSRDQLVFGVSTDLLANSYASAKMVIQDNGNVGIGTTSPGVKLEINTSDDEHLRLRNNSANNNFLSFYSGATRKAYLQAANDEIYFNNEANGGMHLYTNSAERLTILAAGNVGIGNTTPLGRFQVGTTDYTGLNTTYKFNNFGPFNIMERDDATDSYLVNNAMYTSGGVWKRLLTGGATRIGSNSDATGALDFKVAGSDASGTTFTWTDAMTILSSGYVGIGTTTPGYKLDVNGGINVPADAWVSGAGRTLIRDSYFGYSNSYRVTQVGADLSTRNLALGVDPTSVAGGAFFGTGEIALPNSVEFIQKNAGGTDWLQNVLVLSNGNVGIGASPSTKLHVAGSSILANNTAIDPDAYGNTVVAGAIADGSGWGVSSAIGGNGGTGHSYAIGVNGVNMYMAYGNGSANDSLQTFLQVSTNRNVTLVPTSGNVGIGTTGPGEKLEVIGNARLSGLTGSNGDVASALKFWNTNSTGYELARIQVQQGNADINSGAIQFYTGNSGDFLEKVRITSTGLVGIGTAAPVSALDVIRPGNSNVYENGIRTNRPDSQGQYAFMGYGSGSSDAYFGSVYTGVGAGTYGSIHLRQYDGAMNALDTLNINGSGNVGIGTTVPSDQLSVSKTTGTSLSIATGLAAGTTGSPLNTDINFRGYQDYISARIRSWDESGSTAYGNLSFWTASSMVSGNGNLTERMRINQNGNVGIGTASPGSSKLQILESGSGFTQEKTSGGYFTSLGFNGSNSYLTYYAQNNFTIGYGTSTGVAPSINTFSLTPAGNVGIGTTSPQAKLEIGTGNLSASGAIERINTANANVDGLNISNWTGVTATYGPRIVFDNSGFGGFYLGGSDGAYNFDIGRSWGTPDIRINSSGNVGIGRTNPSFKLDVIGNGIATYGDATGSGIVLRGGAAGVTGAIYTDYLSGAEPKLHLSTYSGKDNTSGITIDTSGNVGIGTTTPADKLQVSGGYVSDMTGRLARNLLDTNTWTVSNNGIGNWSDNADVANESVRAWSTGPFGREALVWKDVSDGSNGPSGGWNYSNIPVDNNKAYRYVVWFKRLDSTAGSIYLGADSSNTNNLDGTQNSNPYFFAVSTSSFTVGRWYMFVGYIHAANDASTTNYSAIYDGITGLKVLDGTDFKNRGDTNYQTHRAFSYYNTAAGTTNVQWGPRFEQMDGSEPTIEAMLGVTQASTLASTGYFAGSVGIGTATPSFPLSFGTGTGNKIALYDATGGTGYGFGIQPNLLQIFANSSTDRVGIGYGYSGSFAETLTIKGAKVGIGATDPASLLEIAGSAQTAPLLTLLETTSNTATGIALKTAVPNAAARNWAISYNFSEYGDFALVQSNAQLGDPFAAGTERFHIAANGNVGIGTATPGHLLEIKAGIPAFRMNATAGSAIKYDITNTGDIFSIGTSAQPKFAMNSSGRILLADGAGDATTRLQVADDSASTGGITIGTGSNADSGNLRLLSSTNHWNLDNYSGGLRFFTESGYGSGGSVKMTLAASGDLTTTAQILAPNGSASAPSYSFSSDTNTGIWNNVGDALELVTGGGNRIEVSNTIVSINDPVQLAIHKAGSAGTPALYFSGGTDSDSGFFHPASSTIALSTGGTERMRWTSGGNVGIGISPSEIFHVNKSGGATVIIGNSDNSASDNALQFRSGYSGLANGDDITSSIMGAPDSATGGRLIFSTTTTGGTLTEWLRIDASGLADFTGGIHADGNIDADGTICQNGGGCVDIAELYPVTGYASAGDIMQADPDNEIFVKKAAGGAIIGIISTQPAILIEGSHTIIGGPSATENESKVAIALAGRVPVKVNGENGNIVIGDKISLSSVPGVGKKANGKEVTVGVAMDSWSGSPSDTGYVTVFVSKQEVDNSAFLEMDLNLKGIAGEITPLAGSANESFVVAFFTNMKTKIGEWLADAANGITAIFSDNIYVKNQLCIGATCINETQLKALLEGTPAAASTTSSSSDEDTPPSQGGEEPTATTTTSTDSETLPASTPEGSVATEGGDATATTNSTTSSSSDEDTPPSQGGEETNTTTTTDPAPTAATTPSQSESTQEPQP